MSIQVSCPNGHVLRVKDSFAGKSGYCPHCRAKVHVPQPIGFSEDDVINVLGPPPPAPAEEPEPETEADALVHQSPRHQQPEEESGVGLAGSSILRRAKLCPSCHTPTSFSFSICPKCGTPLPSTGWNPTTSAGDSAGNALDSAHQGPSPPQGPIGNASDENSSAPTKSCVKCTQEIDAGTRICPHCHTYIGGLADLQGSRS